MKVVLLVTLFTAGAACWLAFLRYQEASAPIPLRDSNEAAASACESMLQLLDDRVKRLEALERVPPANMPTGATLEQAAELLRRVEALERRDELALPAPEEINKSQQIISSAIMRYQGVLSDPASSDLHKMDAIEMLGRAPKNSGFTREVTDALRRILADPRSSERLVHHVISIISNRRLDGWQEDLMKVVETDARAERNRMLALARMGAEALVPARRERLEKLLGKVPSELQGEVSRVLRGEMPPSK